MTATFRKFLVFDVAAGESGALEFFDRPRCVLCAAETGVRIHDARNFHRARDVTGKLRHFRQRQQPDVRHAGCRVTQTCAADVKRVESRALHEPAHGGVEYARHRDATVCDQFP